MLSKLSKVDISRALLYAATIVLGTYTAFTELDQGKIDNFWRFVLLCILLLFIELFTGIYYRRHLIQTRLPDTDEHLRFVQITYHFVLPLTMYANVLAFTYFEPQSELRVGIMGVLFVALTVLFINIRAYYTHRRKLEHQTHAIYDILKFIVIFTGVSALTSFARSGQSFIVASVIVLILYLVLLLLFIVREHNFAFIELLLAFVFSILMTVFIGWLSANYAFSTIVLGFIGALGFYLSSATLHHILHRNLTWQIVSEYLLIAIMTLIVLFGLYVPAP
jgi:hypothetical protein